MSRPPPSPSVTIRCLDGRRFRLDGATGADLLLHPQSMKFLIPCAAVFATLDRGRDQSLAEAGSLALLILLTGFCWAALLIGILRGRGIAAVYTPLLLLPLFALASATVWLGLALFDPTAAPVGPDWLRLTLRDLCVLLCMDLAFSQFVAPLHPLLHLPDQQRPAPEPEPEPETPPEQTDPATETLTIGTERFDVADLVAIRAEDHYLRIGTATGRHMLRGRLSDATAQIDMRRGMQVNRSAWVAFAAIRTVEEDGKGLVTLCLTDGTTERLAQSRRIAFHAAMAMLDRA